MLRPDTLSIGVLALKLIRLVVAPVVELWLGVFFLLLRVSLSERLKNASPLAEISAGNAELAASERTRSWSRALLSLVFLWLTFFLRVLRWNSCRVVRWRGSPRGEV